MAGSSRAASTPCSSAPARIPPSSSLQPSPSVTEDFLRGHPARRVCGPWRTPNPSTTPARVIGLGTPVRSLRWLRSAGIALFALGLSLPPSSALAQSRRNKRAKQAQPAPVEKADSWDADAEDALAPEPAPRAAEASEPSELPSEANDGAEPVASETEAAPEDAQVEAGAFGPRRVAQEHRPDAATYRLPKDRVWAPLVWDGGRMHAQVE